VQAKVQRLKTGPIQLRDHTPTKKACSIKVAAPPLDSPFDGPVTYPGDIKTLVKSSKGRSGPPFNYQLQLIYYMRTQYQVCHFFGINHCSLINIHKNTNVTKIENIFFKCFYYEVSNMKLEQNISIVTNKCS
jgi:hypothetical protein